MIPKLVLRLAGVSLLGLSLFGLSIQLGSADAEIEDRKLEAFINAALAVDSVMDKWQPRIVQARAGDETEELHKKANEEIRTTIEHADGISYDEYQQIRKAISANPDMLARVTKIMWKQQNP